MSKRIQWRKILGLDWRVTMYADKKDYGTRIKINGHVSAEQLELFKSRLEAAGLPVYDAVNATSTGSAYGMPVNYNVVLIKVGHPR
jgi:hypothetical protein